MNIVHFRLHLVWNMETLLDYFLGSAYVKSEFFINYNFILVLSILLSRITNIALGDYLVILKVCCEISYMFMPHPTLSDSCIMFKQIKCIPKTICLDRFLEGLYLYHHQSKEGEIGACFVILRNYTI